MNRYELLSVALESNLGHSGRAEKDRNHLALFVDPINVASLTTNANQLVYGRRGAGKTMMFRSLNDKIGEELSVRRISSFYYSATDFRSSSDESLGRTTHVRTMAHRYFHAFIQQLVDDILTLMDDAPDREAGSGTGRAGRRVTNAERRSRRIRIDNLGLKLLEASGYGTDAVDLTALQNHTSVTTVTSRDRSKALGISATRSRGVDFEAAAKGRKSSKSTTSEVAEFGNAKQFEPHHVRACLHEMLELLEVEHVVLLIDEWMSLTECQVEFAERLKQCLFGEPRIAVKIAADQYQGHLNNSEPGTRLRGIEIGPDITLCADLDAPFRDPARCRDLLSEALYRRLLSCAAELEEVFGPPDQFNADYFLESLFSSRHAFDELCYAAQGLCRDFFELFERVSKLVDLRVSSSKQISHDDVQRAIVEQSRTIYIAIEDKVDLFGLFQLIIELLKDVQGRFFVIPSTVKSHDDLLRDLMQERVIHGVDRTWLDPSIRAQYRVFEMDYGVFLETARTVEFATGERQTLAALTKDVGRITSANVERYILDLDRLKREDMVKCTNPECLKVFPTSSPSWVMKQLCPRCFEPIEGDRTHE